MATDDIKVLVEDLRKQRETLEKKEDMKKYAKQILEIVNEINKFSLEEQKGQFENLGKEIHKRKYINL